MELDLSKFAFPSDKITIGTLRKLHPEDFDAEMDSCVRVFATSLGESERKTSQDMCDLLYLERFCAACAVAKAKGDTFGVPGLDENESIDELKQLYVKYGLASGPQHAEQLIRSIDSQAQSIVKTRSGR